MNKPGNKPIALEARDSEDGRLMSPSAARNLAPIMAAFEVENLTKGRVLECGCGTGEHAANLVKSHANLDWVATDLDLASVDSCRAWAEHFAIEDRLTARQVDLSDPKELISSGPFDLIYSSNVIHIAPTIVLNAIVGLAGRILTGDGQLVFYGPFSRDGLHTSDSNMAFDQRLRDRHREWGVRDLEGDVVPLAKKAGMELKSVTAMPANNFFVVFSKESKG